MECDTHRGTVVHDGTMVVAESVAGHHRRALDLKVALHSRLDALEVDGDVVVTVRPIVLMEHAKCVSQFVYRCAYLQQKTGEKMER